MKLTKAQLTLLLAPPVVTLIGLSANHYLESKQNTTEMHQAANVFQQLSYPDFSALETVSTHLPSKDSGKTSKPSLIQKAEKLNASDDPLLKDLDLSALSPELAQKFKHAINNEPLVPVGSSDVRQIEKEAHRWKKRLPPINLQTHMYASEIERRSVKINGVDVREGDSIGRDLVLIEIMPQRVVFEFRGELISLPALYEWQG